MQTLFHVSCFKEKKSSLVTVSLEGKIYERQGEFLPEIEGEGETQHSLERDCLKEGSEERITKAQGGVKGTRGMVYPSLFCLCMKNLWPRKPM